MPDQIYLPDQVKSAIEAHLRQSIRETKEDYLSASEDEDSLVSHFGAKAQIRNQKVQVDNSELGGIWTWSIEYTKFRGRGPQATESVLGADGIIKLTVDLGGFNPDSKSALFQAKIEGRADSDLVQQCAKLSTWREAAFVLNFQPNDIEATTIDEVFRASHSSNRQLAGQELSSFIVNEFLACKLGDQNLEYDARRKILIWRAMNTPGGMGAWVATQFAVRHRLGLGVKAPQSRRRRPVPELIERNEIHLHRMHSSPLEILGLQPDYTESELKKRRRELANTYHPDRHIKMDPVAAELLKRRMQEFNSSYDDLTGGGTKRRRSR